MSSSLLQVVPFPAKRRSAVPLLLEFAVHPDTAPFLVSSTRGTMWIENTLRDSYGPSEREVIRAALRKVDPETYLQEVVDAVVVRGMHAQWENVHPLTAEGIQAAVGYLHYFDIEDVELLVPEDMHPDKAGDLYEQIKADIIVAPWLRPNMVVAVPVDRSYLGFISVRRHSVVSVVHNPSRGMAVAMAPADAEAE